MYVITLYEVCDLDPIEVPMSSIAPDSAGPQKVDLISLKELE